MIIRFPSIHLPHSGFILLAWVLVFCISCKKEFQSDADSSSPIEYFFGGYEDKVAFVEKTSDGGFIYGGSTNTGVNGKDAFLLKVDHFGNKQWYKTYGGRKYDYFNHVIETSDGGYLAIGASNSIGKGTWDSTNCLSDYVVKTNANGDVMWARSYNSSTNTDESAAFGALESKLGFYYITGKNSVSGTNRIYIHRLKTDGTFTYDSIYPFNYYYSNLTNIPPYTVAPNYYHAWGVSLCEALDGSLFLGGLMSLSNIPGQASKYVTFLMHLFHNGSPISMNPYYSYPREGQYYFAFDNPRRTPPVKVKVMQNGCLIATYIEGLQGKLTIQLLRTDFNGNLMWEKQFPVQGYSLLHNIEANPDGTFLLIGSSSSAPFNSAYPELFSSLKNTLILVDKDGNALWTKTIGSDFTVNNARCVQPLAEGGWRVAAYSSSSETGYDRMFTMRVNKNGDLITK
ncbi:MAG: hypothetical protein WC760_09475 [Bacteroidia bacterium]|jgi:hypothetical protein